MGSSERGEAGLYSTGKTHRECLYRKFQRQTPAGVPGRELVHVSRRCEDQDRGVAERLQRAPAPQQLERRNAAGIRGGLAAISDRKSSWDPNLKSVQGWGQVQFEHVGSR